MKNNLCCIIIRRQDMKLHYKSALKKIIAITDTIQDSVLLQEQKLDIGPKQEEMQINRKQKLVLMKKVKLQNQEKRTLILRNSFIS